jgi:Spx/MgsR family transcriptional regulator
MTTSSPITLYGIPQCGSVKKGRTWFQEQGIEITFHDFKKQGIDETTLRHWLAHQSWEVLVNRKGTTWRNLDEATRQSLKDDSSACALMLAHPSVIKRPVIVKENEVIVGVNPDQWVNVIR